MDRRFFIPRKILSLLLPSLACASVACGGEPFVYSAADDAAGAAGVGGSDGEAGQPGHGGAAGASGAAGNPGHAAGGASGAGGQGAGAGSAGHPAAGGGGSAGESAGGKAGSGGMSGGESGGAAGSGAGMPCGTGSTQFECIAGVLFACDLGSGQYEMQKDCTVAGGTCDAELGVCQICTPGQPEKTDTCPPGGTSISVCKADGTGYTTEACTGSQKCSNNSCAGCNQASDCPPPLNPTCAAATCDSGICGLQPEPKGTPDPGGPSGACYVSVCDGMGSTENQNTAAMTPVKGGTVCAPLVCDGMGGTKPQDAAAGTSDPGGPAGPCYVSVCDGAGNDKKQAVNVGGTCTDPSTMAAGLCGAAGSCLACLDTPVGPGCAEGLTCDPTETPPASTGIFVDPIAGNDVSGNGTESAPFQSVGKALSIVEANRTDLYLAPGTYGGSVSISGLPALTLHGGWNAGSWTRDCSMGAYQKTILVNKNASGVVLPGPAVTISGQTATFERLTIEGAAPTTTSNDQPGASAIGLFVSDASAVTLTAVALTADSGAPGGAGSQGTTGKDPFCASNPPCSTGHTGLAGMVGADFVSTLGLSASGYTPSAGQPGTAAGSGNNGACSAPVPPLTCTQTMCFPQIVGGKVEGCSSSTSTVQRTPLAGAVGCGGVGGGGGLPGQGGGASIGLYVADSASSVDLIASSLLSSNGGNGGAGGPGGVGALGTNGQPGTTVSCENTSGCTETFSKMCVDQTMSMASATGPTGAQGGQGGTGGPGGAGEGGPSFGVVMTTGATVTFSPSSPIPIQVGMGGLGANAAATRASSGAMQTF